jgi:hypothetical protein
MQWKIVVIFGKNALRASSKGKSLAAVLKSYLKTDLV